MHEKLWETIKEWRNKGIEISDETAKRIYTLCQRKMEVAKVADPDNYIFFLYPDEVKAYIFRSAINTRTFLMMKEKESACEHYKNRLEQSGI